MTAQLADQNCWTLRQLVVSGSSGLQEGLHPRGMCRRRRPSMALFILNRVGQPHQAVHTGSRLATTDCMLNKATAMGCYAQHMSSARQHLSLAVQPSDCMWMKARRSVTRAGPAPGISEEEGPQLAGSWRQLCG